jgi:hypothetical protein
MTTFFATMTYELDASTDPVAKKLLVAELVGRRWQDRLDGALLPAGSVWARRAAPESDTTTDVHAACGKDLEAALAAVLATGRAIGLRRAWVHVSGGGTYGLVSLRSAPP